MKKIGLTGGIGSGKTTVATHLADRGIPVIDADQIARDIVAPGSGTLGELAEEFGADILHPDGSLNRALLARKAFASDEDTARLNAIMHPAIRAETARRFAEYAAAGQPAVVYDMPLLVDLGQHTDMDLVLVVDADVEERVRRLVTYRGLDEDDARRRIAQQIDDDTRRSAADIIIDNNATPDDLKRRLKTLGPDIEKALGIKLVRAD